MSDDDNKKSNDLTIHLTMTAAPSSPRVPIQVSSETTPSELRLMASNATHIPLSSLRLIFRGRLIGDNNEMQKGVVEEFNLEEGSVVHCMGKPAVATAATAAVPSSAGSSVSLIPPAAALASTVSSAGGGDDALTTALTTLRSSNPPATYLTAVTTLEKILENITSHPMEEKYRSVKKHNAAFARRLGGVHGGPAALLAVGFTLQTINDEECYVMQANAEAWPKLLASKQAVSRAVVDAKAAAAAPTAPPPAVSGFGMPAMPASGMGATAGGGMPPPGMENAVANLMLDPNALQSMLQNPMVRQMMERDPRFANNPMMRQSLETMANNPAMLAQMSQMMRDPAMRSQMQSMMMQQQQQGGGMGMGSSGGGIMGSGFGNNANTSGTTGNPPAANTSGTTGGGGNNNNNASGSTDEEMTEEEMIAEAIARSLRDS